MLTTYRKLWDLFDRRGRLGLLALLLVMLLAALVEALAIVAVVPFLSALKGDSAALPGAWARLAVGGDDGLPATGVALAFVVLVVLAIALKAVADYAAMAFSAAQSARWSRRLLRVHLNRDYDWFLGQHSANIGYGLLARVQEVVVNSLLPALRIIVSAMVVGCILAVLVPAAPAVIFLVAAALVAAYSLVFMLLRRRFATLGDEKEQVGALRFRLVGELFAGIKEVKLHGLEAAYHDATREPFRRFAALISQRHLFSVLPRYVLEALGFAALALAVLVLGRREAGLDGVLPLLGLLGFAAFRLLPAVQQVYGNAVSLPMALLWPGQGAWPVKVVPVCINTVQFPLPSAARCWKLGQAVGRAIRSWDADQRVVVMGTGGLSHQLDGERAGFINKDFDVKFMDSLLADPAWATKYSITDLVELTGTQGIELLMWLAARGALGDKVTQVHRNYHIPISNTAAGLMVMESC